MKLSRIILAMLLASNAIWCTGNLAFQWPDSTLHGRALVNVNNYIATRPRAWFSHDTFVTDFQVLNVTPGTHAQAGEQYQKVRSLLESWGLQVGTYMSGTTVTPEADHTTWPPATVSIEQMPAAARYVGSWPRQPRRKIIDVTDPDTRHAFQSVIRQLWQSEPAPIRFVDNAAVHPSVARMQPWEAYCENIEEIRKLGEALGSRVVFNIAMHVGMLSDSDALLLMQAVGDHGIALEMPWHRTIRENKEATQRAQERYRQLLDTGMGIIMIPVDTPEDVLAAWLGSWKKPADHVYISSVFWKPPSTGVHTLR